MSTPIDPVESLPTQIAYPARTLLRTIVQNLVGLLVAFVARKFGYDIAGWSQPLVDIFTAATWALGATAATWIMTRPFVVKILANTVLAPKPAPAPAPEAPAAASPSTTVDHGVTTFDPGDGSLPTKTY